MKENENPLRSACELAQAGRTVEAITCLEDALARSRTDNPRPGNASLLAKTAALFCEQAGRLLQAASYYGEAIASGTQEPLTLVALADVLFRLGQVAEAQGCLAKAEALAQSSSDGETLEAVVATRARWMGGQQ